MKARRHGERCEGCGRFVPACSLIYDEATDQAVCDRCWTARSLRAATAGPATACAPDQQQGVPEEKWPALLRVDELPGQAPGELAPLVLGEKKPKGCE